MQPPRWRSGRTGRSPSAACAVRGCAAARSRWPATLRRLQRDQDVRAHLRGLGLVGADRHRVAGDHAFALEPRQSALHRGARQLELARQVGGRRAGVLAQQREQGVIGVVEAGWRSSPTIVVELTDLFRTDRQVELFSLHRQHRQFSTPHGHGDPAMKDILIVGAGKIGQVAADLLAHAGGDYRVTLADRAATALARGRASPATGHASRRRRRRRRARRRAARALRGAERGAVSPDEPHRRGGPRRQDALPGSHRGRRQHAAHPRARCRCRDGVHSAVRPGAGLRLDRRCRPGTPLRQARQRAHARRCIARLPEQRTELQPDVEHRRRHQRVHRAVRSHRRRPPRRGAGARGTRGVRARRRSVRGFQHLRRPGHAGRDARRHGAHAELPHHPLPRSRGDHEGAAASTCGCANAAIC